MAIGIVIGLIIGLIIGFIAGARARKLAAAIAALKQAFKPLAQATDAGEMDDALKEDEDEITDLNDVDDFLNNDSIPGLDDHADLEFNPIITYKIKLAKEEQRKEKRRAQLIADGYDPDEMDESAAAAAAGAAGAMKQNALATLIAAGARVTPMAASQSAEAQQREERRRAVRTVDTFLNKSYDVDVTRLAFAQKSGEKKQRTALEVARLSQTERAGSGFEKRAIKAIGVAKDARNQFRELQKLRPQEVASGVVTGKRRGGDRLTNAQLSELQAELLEDDDDELDELGEEGGEDGDDDGLDA